MATGSRELVGLLLFTLTCNEITGCGIITHIEISHRAVDHFADSKGNFTFQKLILKHKDAFQAGSPYPDAYYPGACADGKYHDIAEDSHWTGFLNATLTYIHQKYPQPWDEEYNPFYLAGNLYPADRATEKLVVFTLAFVSHQVADVLWHNLGITEGFIQTMANINFHGVFGHAHSAADLGGDVLSAAEFDLQYIHWETEWYVPVDDLYNIYVEMYGKERLPKDVIVSCTGELFMVRLAEVLGFGKLFPVYADKSPFLVDELSNYFEGGIDDMAAWSQLIWKHVVFMLESGRSECYLPHSPLFITCRDNSHVEPQSGSWGSNRKSAREAGIPMTLLKHGLTQEDIVVEKAYRGIRFRVSDKLKRYINQKFLKKRQHSKSHKTMAESRDQPSPRAVYTVQEKYAKVGWSLVVGDLNADGHDDLAVGAPGHGTEFSSQDGRVYIIYGTTDGLPLKEIENLNTAADRVIKGPSTAQARFGSSLAIVDINMDGTNDLVVGAPNYNSTTTPLKYNGMVYVYYGSQADLFRYSHVNMTISCQDRFCYNGWSLSSGDTNGDGHPDLILSSPYAPAGGDQRGFVGVLFSSRKYNKEFTAMSVSNLDWIERGTQDYGWFGESTSVLPHAHGTPVLAVNQPMYRNCTRSQCQYNANDTQSEGQLSLFYLPLGSGRHGVKMTGNQQFQKYGASSDIGQPLPGGGSIIAVAASGEDVEGKLVDISTKFHQAGVVHLVNVTDLDSSNFQSVAVYAGDRKYGRFGAKVKFADLNGDGYDDLIISAPFRTSDVTEELSGVEEGRVFIFNGGDKFPTGKQALFNCGVKGVIEPCPGEKATHELSIGQNQARFGSNFAVLNTKNVTNLIISAIHSSDGARLSGAIYVYTFSKSSPLHPH